jgi:hypothetical protein
MASTVSAQDSLPNLETRNKQLGAQERVLHNLEPDR